MIDLHCHILPVVDDGAQDIAAALAMAKMALVHDVASDAHDLSRRAPGLRGGFRALESRVLRTTR